MTIFCREFRGTIKSLLIWSVVMGGLMVLCIALFPSVADSSQVSDLFAGMGDFSAAFGLNVLSVGTIFGFYGVECGSILGLGGAFFAACTAMSLLAGEEGGHTAEFLLTHPVSRTRIAAEKLAAAVMLVAALNLVCAVCGIGAVYAVGEDIPWKELAQFHGMLLLMQIQICGICFGLSALLRRNSFGLAMGLTALLYFLSLVLKLEAGVDWLRFLTPFYYADAALIVSGQLQTAPVWFGCVLGAGCSAAGLWWYCRKDITA